MRRLLAALTAALLLCLSVTASGSLPDGVSYGMAMGRNGWISVSVSVTDGCIAAIEVDAPQETPAKLQQAMQIVARMIGLGDYTSVQAVDAISGATMSSEGIKNAVLNALRDAKPRWGHAEGEPCPSAGFADAPAYGSWAHEPVDWAVSEGITQGVSATSFAPERPCTRAQIVTFLWRAEGSPEPEKTVGFVCRSGQWPPAGEQCSPLQRNGETVAFTDVSPDAYYYDAVRWAVAQGITNGTGAATFSPDAPCTRAQAVTFLWRAEGSLEPEKAVEFLRRDGRWPPAGEQCSPLQRNGETVTFTDVSPDAYYYDAVRWAVARGITNGTGAATFSPNAPCTRAQIVTLLFRAGELPDGR